MLSLFIRLLLLVSAIFSADAASYQSLSSALNLNQYYQQHLKLNSFNPVSASQLVAINHRKSFANNGYLLNSYLIKVIDKTRSRIVQYSEQLLFTHQQLIAEQNYFTIKHLQFKYVNFTLKAFS